MREAWKHLKLCVLLAMCVLFLGAGVKAQAAPAQVQGVEQTRDSSGSVTVSWDVLVADGIKYKIELSADRAFSSVRTNQTNGSQTNFYGLSSGKKYYVRVTAYENSTDTYGIPSKVIEVVTRPESEKHNLRQTAAGTTSISVKWDKKPGANAYRMDYYKVGASNVKKSVYLKDVQSFTAKNLSKNAEYCFQLYPILKSANEYSAIGDRTDTLSYCPVLPGKVEEVTASFSSPSTKYFNLSWDRRDNADGYQYEVYSLASKKAKKLLNGKKESNGSAQTISSNKLAKAQFLKVRVRAYVRLGTGTKYGTWSGWTYTAKQPEIKISNVKGGQKVVWTKVSGAESYTLYISTKRETGYKKVKTLSKNSLTVKKCGKSSLKVGKNYYYTIVANKKIGKKTYHGCKTHCYSRPYYK